MVSVGSIEVAQTGPLRDPLMSGPWTDAPPCGESLPPDRLRILYHRFSTTDPPVPPTVSKYEVVLLSGSEIVTMPASFGFEKSPLSDRRRSYPEDSVSARQESWIPPRSPVAEKFLGGFNNGGRVNAPWVFRSQVFRAVIISVGLLTVGRVRPLHRRSFWRGII